MFRRLIQASLLFCCFGSALFVDVCKNLNIAPTPLMVEKVKDINFGILTDKTKLDYFNTTNSQDCSIVTNAALRFLNDLYDMVIPMSMDISNNNNSFLIRKILIQLNGLCIDSEYPNQGMNEAYTITVNSTENSIEVRADQAWGILHAFSTLILMATVDKKSRMRIPLCNIKDKPQLVHRGFLIDTATRYWKPETIKTHVELMALHKFNVLHWHIVGNNSFPYQSKTFKDMSIKGAFHPHYLHTYTQEDIASIVEFARVRGIRVIPEFDTPANTKSWGRSMPNLLTECIMPETNEKQLGPLNPANSYTYDFLKSLFSDISKDFPDESLHLGGKMPLDCWKNNVKINEFMQMKQFGPNYSHLQNYYMDNLLKAVKETRPKSWKMDKVILWEDALKQRIEFSEKPIIQVRNSSDNWTTELRNVMEKGYKVIVSSCYKLIKTSVEENWIRYYNCTLSDFTDNPLLLGGEASMCSRYVDDSNAIQKMWPASTAIAERLWASSNVTIDINAFRKTMERHMCKMRKKGIAVSPIVDGVVCP